MVGETATPKPNAPFSVGCSTGNVFSGFGSGTFFSDGVDIAPTGGWPTTGTSVPSGLDASGDGFGPGGFFSTPGKFGFP